MSKLYQSIHPGTTLNESTKPVHFGKKVTKTSLAAFLWLLASPNANATTISLDFNSLPSAQGWTYESHNYSGANPSEASVFSVNGSQLTQNTMGKGVTYANYILPNAINPDLPFTISVTARVLQFETTGNSSGRATAFYAFADTSKERFGFSLNTTTFSPNAGTGTPSYLPIDATQFHDYRIEAIPGVSNNIYVDNVLFSTQLPQKASYPNNLYLGNASSFENGLAQITQYSFVQNTNPVPVPAAVWMMGSGLLGLLGVSARRRVNS